MVRKQCTITISDKKMSNFLYALLKCNASLIKSFGIGIGQYNRQQSSGFNVDIIIEIEENKIQAFEQLSGVLLNDGIKVQVNND